MAERGSDTGRAAQRRRTRKAIVTAAAELMSRGRTPSVSEVADAAEVSRRTVYMYFPTLEQLLIDAALVSMTRDTVDAALEAVDAEQDVETRVEALARAVQQNFGATEQQGRTLLRLTLDSPRGDQPSDQPRRGYRRVEWIERAVAPLRASLGAVRFERLVSALAMVIGWEAMIVARDVRALGLEEAEDVSAWAARALVRAALEEGGPAVSKRPAATPRRSRPRGK